MAGSRFRNPLRRRFSGIPYVDLPGRRQTNMTDATGYPIGTSYVTFTFRTATVQASTGDEIEVTAPGLKDKEVFHIFTETRGNPTVEGSQSPGDQVFLDSRYTSDPGWFTVIRAKPWQNNVINHYDLLVVRENEN